MLLHRILRLHLWHHGLRLLRQRAPLSMFLGQSRRSNLFIVHQSETQRLSVAKLHRRPGLRLRTMYQYRGSQARRSPLRPHTELSMARQRQRCDRATHHQISPWSAENGCFSKPFHLPRIIDRTTQFLLKPLYLPRGTLSTLLRRNPRHERLPHPASMVSYHGLLVPP